jgi:N-dimethylarginine dimethylaminohydrolase
MYDKDEVETTGRYLSSSLGSIIFATATARTKSDFITNFAQWITTSATASTNGFVSTSFCSLQVNNE